MSDIAIAQKAKMRPVLSLAAERLGIDATHLDPYGHYKAKVSLEYLDSRRDHPRGKLILVTAISPTPAGEGKTTTSVGLGDALSHIGKKAMICLREPALGPCFGVKGGAAGGGYAQVVPMEDINLHFTGDFHAIAAAHNLLAAMIDNHIHHDNALGIDSRQVSWRRTMDMNDRALRELVVGLGGTANGFARQDGFDIIAASEVMAILCLSRSIGELKRRLGNIQVAQTRTGQPVLARDLKADGAMTALLKDALRPNLVQTLENNPVLVHGGPFANIAHGCNTLIATEAALSLSDYVVTEAGFGADLGAEKFIDIKCRKSGLQPDAVVLVATVRALKYHGGVAVKEVGKENLEALKAGLPNLERHIHNIRHQFGLPCVVAINHFTADTAAEVAIVQQRVAELGAQAVVCRHWAEGGKGAVELAEKVVTLADQPNPAFRMLYSDELPLWDKIAAVATQLYGAAGISADAKVRDTLAKWTHLYPHFPVCIAKTQSSFSADASVRGAPTGHTLPIREVRLARGAEFVVAIAGTMMTMPGLPKVPAAEAIDVDDSGKITGLF